MPNFKIRYPRDKHMDVVIPDCPSLREMLRKYLQTGEMPPLMSEASDSYDFPSVDEVDFNVDLKRSVDLSDFIRIPDSPQDTAAPMETVSTSESATPEGSAPSADLTNGAD